jgi:hypothetical protein
MSKRPSTISPGSGNMKRKHLTLSIKQNMDVMRELDWGYASEELK